MRTAPLFLATLLSTLVATAFAHDHKKSAHSHDHGHKHGHASEAKGDTLSAHQHGVATLNLVIEGNDVAIELDSPADNLVGFEYVPTSDADIQKVKDTMATLREPQRLFVFPEAAGCTSTEVELESPLFKATADADHDHHHDEHKHGDDDHAHGHGHDHADGSTHNDIEAHYHFTCANAAALNQIEVKLFDAFPGTQKLILQAVGGRGQQGGELTPSSNIIRL